MSSENSEKDSSSKMELNLEAFIDERTEICNPVFVDGYSVGW